MFSKPPKSPSAAALDSAPAADNGARKSLRVASLLAGEMTIEGSVTGEGELHVDGSIKGDIRVGKLTIGETGHIEGAVFAEFVEVRGRVVGAITAKQVRLYGTSYVDGDITHEQLAMETGAFFQGRSLKFQRPAPAPPPEALPPPVIQAAEVATEEVRAEG